MINYIYIYIYQNNKKLILQQYSDYYGFDYQSLRFNAIGSLTTKV